MLTPEERRFVASHLRPIGRTATTLAALYVTACAGAYLAGLGLGHGLHLLNQYAHRRLTNGTL